MNAGTKFTPLERRRAKDKILLEILAVIEGHEGLWQPVWEATYRYAPGPRRAAVRDLVKEGVLGRPGPGKACYPIQTEGAARRVRFNAKKKEVEQEARDELSNRNFPFDGTGIEILAWIKETYETDNQSD